MQNVELDFVEFDSMDVIVTSGGGGGSDPIPSTIEIIWLSASSVDNYNAYSPDTSDDLILMLATPPKAFYAFNGAGMGNNFYAMKGQNETPDHIFTVTSSTDKAGYDAVLTWLRGRSGQ